MSKKLEFNKKMINREVVVLQSGGQSWDGLVIDVKDETIFFVKEILGNGELSEKTHEVDIYDIRQRQ